MRELNVREMRAKIGQLDQLVAESGELIIRRHGKPVARVLPVTPLRKRPDHADLRRRMEKLNTPSAELIRTERDER